MQRFGIWWTACIANIDHATFTPSEIREAAMLAHILYEERRIRPMIIDNVGEIIRDLR
jgi:hypothetical protein